MLKKDSLARNSIAELIRSVVDDVVREHVAGLTQEHQLTSRICGALEARLRGLQCFGCKVRIVTQEIPDRGRGSLEKKSGVDLYIGIEISNGQMVSKGLFIQAKWKEDRRTVTDQKGLLGQCVKISGRTHAGYVWLYGPSGVDVISASEVIKHPNTPPEQLGSRKLDEHFQQVLDCFEGDFSLGLPPGSDTRIALGQMLREFSIPAGIAIQVTSRDGGD